MAIIRFKEIEGDGEAVEVNIQEASKFLPEGGWLDILNPGEEEKNFLLKCGFHPLSVEDCFSEPVTRFYVYEGHKFVVLLGRDKDKGDLDTDFLNVFIRENHIVTVRNSEMPAIDEFEDRMRNTRSENRNLLGSEFLLYELLDEVADDWYNILEKFNERLEVIEERVLDPRNKYPDLLDHMHDIKQDLREISKSTMPLSRAIIRMMRPDSNFVSDDCKLYFEDLTDQIRGISDQVSNLSAGAGSVRDTYLNQTSMRLAESNQRLTEVISTITIIGAIILPLTLISSIFGMNVDSLRPENGTQIIDLPEIIAIMIFFSIFSIWYFRNRGWLK